MGHSWTCRSSSRILRQLDTQSGLRHTQACTSRSRCRRSILKGGGGEGEEWGKGVWCGVVWWLGGGGGEEPGERGGKGVGGGEGGGVVVSWRGGGEERGGRGEGGVWWLVRRGCPFLSFPALSLSIYIIYVYAHPYTQKSPPSSLAHSLLVPQHVRVVLAPRLCLPRADGRALQGVRVVPPPARVVAVLCLWGWIGVGWGR